MGRSIDFHIREQIVKDCQSGMSYPEVSRKYSVRFNTVKGLHQRYQKEGVKGLRPHYENCGKEAPSEDNILFRASCWLKRIHPQWGAPFILIQLKERYPQHQMPTSRTLQRWFKLKNLNKRRNQLPNAPMDWAEKVHGTWQVDAKERIVLADGSQGCWLTVVDEKSGATLATLVFPPQQNLASSGRRDQKGA
jgi:hypothetical protein